MNKNFCIFISHDLSNNTVCKATIRICIEFKNIGYSIQNLLEFREICSHLFQWY
jgi:hypothetical protein